MKRLLKRRKPVNYDSDYDASVGALDKKADEYARLTVIQTRVRSADSPTCSESYSPIGRQSYMLRVLHPPSSSETQSDSESNSETPSESMDGLSL